MSGVYDGIVAPAHALRYYQAARNAATEKSETVRLVNIDHAAHFELIAPWTEPGREVVRQIIAATKADENPSNRKQP